MPGRMGSHGEPAHGMTKEGVSVRSAQKARLAPAWFPAISARVYSCRLKTSVNPGSHSYLQEGNLNDVSRAWKLKRPLAGMYWFTYQKVQSSEGSMAMLL